MTHLTDARGTRLRVGQTVTFVQYNDLGFGTVKKIGDTCVEVHPHIAAITASEPDYTEPMAPDRVAIVETKGHRR